MAPQKPDSGKNMEEIKFDYHRVPARKDLLHFIEEHADKEVYEKIGENPSAWLDELQIISNMLTGQGLVGGIGLKQPPLGDKDFRELGNRAYLYRGADVGLRGLWIKKNRNLEKIAGSTDEWARKKLQKIVSREEWTHYSIGTTATLSINQEFSDIKPEIFLPDNIESKGRRVKKNKNDIEVAEKRKIYRFQANHNGQEVGIYAKGAYVNCMYYYSYAKPGFRLTTLSDIVKISSQKEMEITLDLARLGVKVPTVIGYYKEPLEEFLFLTEVEGKTPDKCGDSDRKIIIKQDATMLAALCLGGFRKVGFTDFDDKIFDRTNLYLIDVEECGNLYYSSAPNFREMLLNPKNTSALTRFRRLQRQIFKRMLKDALFEYKQNLIPTREDQSQYIRAFHEKIGWSKPTEREITRLTDFPENYITFGSEMAMMSDVD